MASGGRKRLCDRNAAPHPPRAHARIEPAISAAGPDAQSTAPFARTNPKGRADLNKDQATLRFLWSRGRDPSWLTCPAWALHGQ
jgi:hypothetical protein